MEFISRSIKETREIARKFSEELKPGDIVALNGDLGVGKTAFTAGIADGLGISNCVSSPTFTIINEYRNGKIPLYHFDLYRLKSEDDLYDIGIDEYIDGVGICVFEWPELAESLAEKYFSVEITKDLSVSEDYRKITITEKSNVNENSCY